MPARLQAWLFGDSFWTYNRTQASPHRRQATTVLPVTSSPNPTQPDQAFLSGVPLGRLLILDLSSSDSIAQRYDGYFGHDWIWTALLSFGGRRGLYGFANAYASNPYKDRAGVPNIVGLGITGEASEIIPSQFGGSWVGHSGQVRGVSRIFKTAHPRLAHPTPPCLYCHQTS